MVFVLQTLQNSYDAGKVWSDKMVLLVQQYSTLSNVLRLIALLIVFILILVAVYYTTKWLAKTGMIQPGTSNISVIETCRLAQNKGIQIVKIGERYFAIALGKDEVTFISELKEEELQLTKELREPDSFKEILGKVFENKKKNKKN